MLERTTFRALVALGLAVVACVAGTPAVLAASDRPAISAPQQATARGAALPEDTTRELRDALFAGVNADRATQGLVAYVRDPALERVAESRAERLSVSPAFGHPFAGAPILDAVEATGIGPLGVGEALGWSSQPGSVALASVRAMWGRSASHAAIVLSDTSSYAGVGVAVAGGRTFVALVTAETLDRTPPVVETAGAERQGAAVVVRWTALDPLLQTHTAGLRDAAVEYRLDGGPWLMLQRANARGIAAIARPRPGHMYEVRIRARDRAGNVSPWVETSPIRIP